MGFCNRYKVFKRLNFYMGYFLFMEQYQKASKIADTMDRLKINKWYFWLMTGSF